MSHRDRFYTITQRALSTGGVKRVYIVTCSKCGRQGEQHAGQLTDDMRKKGFQRLGWEIGRWKNLHICPQCAGNAPAEPEGQIEEPALPEIPPPKTWVDDLPKLQAAWTLAYEDEHLAFIEWLKTTYGDRYIPAPVAPTPPTLEQVWEQASENERVAFWQFLQRKQGPTPPPCLNPDQVRFVAKYYSDTFNSAARIHKEMIADGYGDQSIELVLKAIIAGNEKKIAENDAEIAANNKEIARLEAPEPPPPADLFTESADDGGEDWYVELMQQIASKKKKAAR